MILDDFHFALVRAKQSSQLVCLVSPKSLIVRKNGNFRLSVADCALLQGFPEDWQFSGAVYQALGQIGNSVCPPVAYAVARQVALALGAER